MDEQTHTDRSRTRASLLIGATLVILMIITWILWRWWTAPVPPSDRPLDLPIEQPEISTLTELTELMAEKPLPPAFDGASLPPIREDDHVYGSRSALFSIVEYTNFGNAYAALLHDSLREYVDASNGEVNWIVRHYPASANDFLPAQAAECAYFEKRDEGFWPYFQQSFSLKQPTKETLIALAATLKLDIPAFTQCLDQHFTRDRVLLDIQEGRVYANVTVVPSYIVVRHETGDMRLAEGVNPLSYLQEIIRKLR